LLYLLFRAALRSPRDLPALGKVVVAAALVKAVLAFYVRHTLSPHDIRSLPYATSRADSVLFAGACSLLLARFIERPNRRHLTLLALTLPVLFLGMVANNRRLVWVELGL